MEQGLVYADIDGGDAWGNRKQVRMAISPTGIHNSSVVVKAIDELILKSS